MDTGSVDPSEQGASQTSAGFYTRHLQQVATGGDEIYREVSQGRAECTVPPLLGAEDSNGAQDENRMSGESERRSPPSVLRL